MIKPAALTLKSCKKTPVQEDKPTVKRKLQGCDALGGFGLSTYCDGPKHRELLTYQAAADLLSCALDILPTTKVGVSVISAPDEEYAELFKTCSRAHFFELNLKYAFRLRTDERISWIQLLKEKWPTILKEIERFCEAIPDKPLLIKLSRELTWLPATAEFEEVLTLLNKHGKAGLIVANSLKTNMPPIIEAGSKVEMEGGVVCGEHLFVSTVNMIRGLGDACRAHSIPIVASGGMVREEQILEAFRVGASGVQLCTAFDYFGLEYYETLRSSMRARIHLQALNSFEQYQQNLPSMSISAIYAPVILYFPRFWSEELQSSILDDIEKSTRMDVIALSAFSLVQEWRERLRARFERNRGLRLFLPNTEIGIFDSVQASWGHLPPSIKFLKERVSAAREIVETLWKETATARQTLIGESPGTTEATFEVIEHDQCPFYSAYCFDGKVYMAPYPFVWEPNMDVPVYVHFGNSGEYKRITEDLLRIRGKVITTRLRTTQERGTPDTVTT